MADQQKVLIVDPVAQAREQFNDEMREIAKNPLDRAKSAGGYYINADGSGAHDANGNPVELRSGDKASADAAKNLTTLRAEAQSATETEAMDSPEEVADRGGPVFGSGQPFTPAAVEAGTILPDGSTSQPDSAKKGTRKSGKK